MWEFPLCKRAHARDEKQLSGAFFFTEAGAHHFTHSSSGAPNMAEGGGRLTSASFRRIADSFTSLADVTAALRRAGVESSNLVVAVDFTTSNKSQGRVTFEGHSLHDTSWAGHPTVRSLL